MFIVYCGKMEKTVMIGDYIGTIEEFLPGEGTYAEDGKIYASNMGELVLDRENHVAKVMGKQPAELKVGQVVYGDVAALGKNAVTVIVRKIQGMENEQEIKTGIYVSNISSGYVKDPAEMFGIGDIVKGKVIKIEPNLIDLTTKENNLGVVKAFCKRCRAELKKSEKFRDRMECPSCGNKEKRKVSDDYEDVKDL